MVRIFLLDIKNKKEGYLEAITTITFMHQEMKRSTKNKHSNLAKSKRFKRFLFLLSPTFFLTSPLFYSFSFNRSGLSVLPHNAKMHYNFGNFLRDSSKPDLAMVHYERALRLVFQLLNKKKLAFEKLRKPFVLLCFSAFGQCTQVPTTTWVLS